MIRRWYSRLMTPNSALLRSGRDGQDHSQKRRCPPRVEQLEERTLLAAGSFQFSSALFLAPEDGGSAIVTVSRTGGSDGGVGITVATRDATARAGTNYTAVSTTLTFALGETSKTVSIPILDDGLINGNQTIVAALSNPTGGASLGTQTTAAVLILDRNGTRSQRFVNFVYQEVLQRNAEPGGLAFWTSQVDQGISRTQVVRMIQSAGSQEGAYNVVQSLYVEFLNRLADASGLNLLVQFLQNGGTVEQVKAFILGSPEYFQTRGGGTNIGFLNSLYFDVLNRNLDDGGRASWLQVMAGRITPSQVAAAVVTSTEGYTNLVQGFYQMFLNRPADSTGLAFFVSFLQQGGRDEQVVALFLSSPEYFSLI